MRLRARSLMGALCLAILLACPPVSAEETQVFSLSEIYSGMPVAEVLAKLGVPTVDSGDLYTYADQHLRVWLDFKSYQRVSAVTGEVDLAFGGRRLARLGQSPEEVVAKLGMPDETMDGGSMGTRVDTYTRFHVTVYYRRQSDAAPFKVVMFSVSSPEWDYVRDTDPADKTR